VTTTAAARKIGILHHDFLCPGGGERLAISLAHVLRGAGI